jgi:hypothetical protein
MIDFGQSIYSATEVDLMRSRFRSDEVLINRSSENASAFGRERLGNRLSDGMTSEEVGA